MLANKEWYKTIDDTVATWCLLVLETEVEEETTYITGWHVGKANVQQVIEIDTMSIDSYDEETRLLKKLGDTVLPLRRSGCTLITRFAYEIPLLRTRMLVCDFDAKSFRGFNHVVVSELLDQYFCVSDSSKEDRFHDADLGNQLFADWKALTKEGGYHHHNPVIELWSVVESIGQLVPSSALSGQQL